jgi:hypothetical protein
LGTPTDAGYSMKPSKAPPLSPTVTPNKDFMGVFDCRARRVPFHPGLLRKNVASVVGENTAAKAQWGPTSEQVQVQMGGF